ncbi:MAG: RdgB/HAM1 family non-canonical purine NTP pyrophosphatase [Clostridia bacterium]|nr:RdgB/HAM1 family non-canonical purine NTP pyrophosphatase [Clostridia bacterium]MBQ4586981.1 RdgB/HAM1 family non-canonical purine NTP pyrophosphatase [Clostridia bacterium]
MQKLVIATKNQGKLKEFKEILGDYFEVVAAADVGYNDDVEETGTTFEENSYIKAKAIYDFCHLPSLADDSGLMVDALNGEPGINSARYAGGHGDDKANYTLLLNKLEGVTDRHAKFVTALTLILDNDVIVTHGQTLGEILHAPVGEFGFGYDPVFFSYDLQKSFGVATPEEKNGVSHRKRAIDALLLKLKELNF